MCEKIASAIATPAIATINNVNVDQSRALVNEGSRPRSPPRRLLRSWLGECVQPESINERASVDAEDVPRFLSFWSGFGGRFGACSFGRCSSREFSPLVFLVNYAMLLYENVLTVYGAQVVVLQGFSGYANPLVVDAMLAFASCWSGRLHNHVTAYACQGAL